MPTAYGVIDLCNSSDDDDEVDPRTVFARLGKEMSVDIVDMSTEEDYYTSIDYKWESATEHLEKSAKRRSDKEEERPAKRRRRIRPPQKTSNNSNDNSVSEINSNQSSNNNQERSCEVKESTKNKDDSIHRQLGRVQGQQNSTASNSSLRDGQNRHAPDSSNSLYNNINNEMNNLARQVRTENQQNNIPRQWGSNGGHQSPQRSVNTTQRWHGNNRRDGKQRFTGTGPRHQSPHYNERRPSPRHYEQRRFDQRCMNNGDRFERRYNDHHPMFRDERRFGYGNRQSGFNRNDVHHNERRHNSAMNTRPQSFRPDIGRLFDAERRRNDYNGRGNVPSNDSRPWSSPRGPRECMSDKQHFVQQSNEHGNERRYIGAVTTQRRVDRSFNELESTEVNQRAEDFELPRESPCFDNSPRQHMMPQLGGRRHNVDNNLSRTEQNHDDQQCNHIQQEQSEENTKESIIDRHFTWFDTHASQYKPRQPEQHLLVDTKSNDSSNDSDEPGRNSIEKDISSLVEKSSGTDSVCPPAESKTTFQATNDRSTDTVCQSTESKTSRYHNVIEILDDDDDTGNNTNSKNSPVEDTNGIADVIDLTTCDDENDSSDCDIESSNERQESEAVQGTYPDFTHQCESTSDESDNILTGQAEDRSCSEQPDEDDNEDLVTCTKESDDVPYDDAPYSDVAVDGDNDTDYVIDCKNSVSASTSSFAVHETTATATATATILLHGNPSICTEHAAVLVDDEVTTVKSVLDNDVNLQDEMCQGSSGEDFVEALSDEDKKEDECNTDSCQALRSEQVSDAPNLLNNDSAVQQSDSTEGSDTDIMPELESTEDNDNSGGRTSCRVFTFTANNDEYSSRQDMPSTKRAQTKANTDIDGRKTKRLRLFNRQPSKAKLDNYARSVTNAIQGQSSGPPQAKSKPVFDTTTNYNYNYSRRDAEELQEKLFRQAAERLRSTSANGFKANISTTTTAVRLDSAHIREPILDIATRHPDHWKLFKSDPYACLGLPRLAPLKLIKSQYRRLARLYHPDKCSSPDSTGSRRVYDRDKFHAISMAFSTIKYDG